MICTAHILLLIHSSHLICGRSRQAKAYCLRLGILVVLASKACVESNRQLVCPWTETRFWLIQVNAPVNQLIRISIISQHYFPPLNHSIIRHMFLLFVTTSHLPFLHYFRILLIPDPQTPINCHRSENNDWLTFGLSAELWQLTYCFPMVPTVCRHFVFATFG